MKYLLSDHILYNKMSILSYNSLYHLHNLIVAKMNSYPVDPVCLFEFFQPTFEPNNNFINDHNVLMNIYKKDFDTSFLINHQDLDEKYNNSEHTYANLAGVHHQYKPLRITLNYYLESFLRSMLQVHYNFKSICLLDIFTDSHDNECFYAIIIGYNYIVAFNHNTYQKYNIPEHTISLIKQIKNAYVHYLHIDKHSNIHGKLDLPNYNIIPAVEHLHIKQSDTLKFKCFDAFMMYSYPVIHIWRKTKINPYENDYKAKLHTAYREYTGFQHVDDSEIECIPSFFPIVKKVISAREFLYAVGEFEDEAILTILHHVPYVVLIPTLFTARNESAKTLNNRIDMFREIELENFFTYILSQYNGHYLYFAYEYELFNDKKSTLNKEYLNHITNYMLKVRKKYSSDQEIEMLLSRKEMMLPSYHKIFTLKPDRTDVIQIYQKAFVKSLKFPSTSNVIM